MSRIYNLASIKEGDIVYISSVIGEIELRAFKNDKNKLCLDHYDPKYITSPTIEISTWMSLTKSVNVFIFTDSIEARDHTFHAYMSLVNKLKRKQITNV